MPETKQATAQPATTAPTTKPQPAPVTPNIPMTRVESSNIESIGWKANQLYVRFLNGGDYAYAGVPEKIFQDMLASESKGHFLAANIKNKFPFRKTPIIPEYKPEEE